LKYTCYVGNIVGNSNQTATVNVIQCGSSGTCPTVPLTTTAANQAAAGNSSADAQTTLALVVGLAAGVPFVAGICLIAGFLLRGAAQLM